MPQNDTTPPSRPLDTLVIGAGPAGIGTALALAAVDNLVYGVVDRGAIGQTFLDWPVQQRFLTPSFTGNGFGATDLNSIHPDTSPAFSTGTDYLDGAQYARYLGGVSRHFGVAMLPDTDVTSVDVDGDAFSVETSKGQVSALTVVWAGGEFHSPDTSHLVGSEHADHASTAAAWVPRAEPVVIIGGYESGIDLACHHIANGSDVLVIDPKHPWDAETGSDPSFRLSPRTRQRLAAARATGRLEFEVRGRVSGIRSNADDFSISISGRSALTSIGRPILATGYGAGLGPTADLFARRPDGWPELDDNDESTITPGLFLSGAALRHASLKFCFVYKFRQRFAHVAGTIAERLGKDSSGLEKWKTAGMLTDDLSCCGVECAC